MLQDQGVGGRLAAILKIFPGFFPGAGKTAKQITSISTIRS
jgi:hypothetical protein